MKTALITGANRGIGLELCRQLKGRGYGVIGVCRRTSSQLDSLGVQVEPGTDVSDRASLEALSARLADTRIDLLVNNAGVLRRDESLDDIENRLDDMRLQYETNSLGPLRVTRALSARLGAGSKVIIISSRVGSIADNTSGGNYGYRMSKAAVNMAGVTLAHELKQRGIAVGILHPGYVRTDMTGNQGFVDSDEAAAGLIARMEELDLETTGSFFHANGEALPW